MKTAIIVHGRPDKEEYFDPKQPKPTEAHWLPWLKKGLEVKGFVVHIPAMPVPYESVYEEWKKVFEQHTVDNETVLIGHSRGGAFILHWLSEHDVHVGKVILVAPSITPNHPVEHGFSEFTIDPNFVSKTQGVTVFYSTDDEEGILESVARIKAELPSCTFREFSNKGHFTAGDGVTEFPELLEEVLK